MPLQPNEADLLGRVADGDDEAFSIFYRRHLDAVVAFFLRRVRDRELAFRPQRRDIRSGRGQRGELFSGEAPPVAWLFGIARNKLRESLRRERVADAARRRLGMEPVLMDDAGLRGARG